MRRAVAMFFIAGTRSPTEAAISGEFKIGDDNQTVQLTAKVLSETIEHNVKAHKLRMW